MQVLPPVVAPPEEVIQRKHDPPGSDYRRFAPCLRWEFGFICPFCLTHEVDHVPLGVKGSGVFSAEHQVPQSVSSESIGRYANCIYCCRFCNRSRSTDPNMDEGGRTLLDPTRVCWSEHFVLRKDEICAVADDHDAQYTIDSYNVNGPRQLDARQVRREKIAAALAELRRLPTDIAELSAVIGQQDAQNAVIIVRHIANLKRTAEMLVEQLHREWPMVPRDASESCNCDAACQIPDVYAKQAIVP
jgi:hypothetical protein